MKKLFYLFLSVILTASCVKDRKIVNTKTSAQLKFTENGQYEELCLAEGLKYEVIFQSGDSITAPDGTLVPSKENLDCNVLLPNSSNPGLAQLFVSFESRSRNKHLGNGGGGMLLDLSYNGHKWNIVNRPTGVDFSTVGETINNCGGKETPYGTILSAEEYYTSSEAQLKLYMGSEYSFGDTKATNNFGYLVEIDPKTKKAIRKLKKLGRFSHEDALCMPDGKTVYITNDESPAVLFKFVALEKNDYTEGQLYAYSESKKWIALPMDPQSLLNIRHHAFKLGATTFTRHEWVTLINNKLYITETGRDNISYANYLTKGATLPSYYDSSFVDDPYGRILCLDLSNDSLYVELEGGQYGENMFSNPDCITSYRKDGNDYLVINEDIVGLNRGRDETGQYVMDVFRYNLKTKELEKILRSPKGAETTGGVFDQYGNYLLNIQHPNRGNKKPFNRSSLIMIKGL